MNTPNNRRAREANTALQAYRLEADNTDLYFHPAPGERDALMYLLANFRHLCDARGWDYGEIDKAAYRAYLEDRESPIADATLNDTTF